MYDFYFGAREEISADPLTFLLAVKRSLPRWANSLPDSEFLYLGELIQNMPPDRRPVFVETGVGASTLLLGYFAMANEGRLISWDSNSSKASFIRSVFADTIEKHLEKAATAHWTFVNSLSLSRHTGIEIVTELTDRVDLSLHDSDHTWETVGGEVEALIPVLADGAVVCVDDANQAYLHTYEPIINMMRKKVGLTRIAPIEGNQCAPLFEKVPELLRQHFGTIEDVSGDIKARLDRDLYYDWYRTDRQRMSETGMEEFETMTKRFGAWKVSKSLAK